MKRNLIRRIGLGAYYLRSWRLFRLRYFLFNSLIFFLLTIRRLFWDWSWIALRIFCISWIWSSIQNFRLMPIFLCTNLFEATSHWSYRRLLFNPWSCFCNRFLIILLMRNFSRRWVQLKAHLIFFNYYFW